MVGLHIEVDMKVKVLMTRTVMAHDETDGGQMLPLGRYAKGEEYEVSESLCKNLMKLGSCERVGNKKSDAKLENKAADAPAENKAAKGKSVNAKQGSGKKGK